jgi:presequence protease
MTFKKISEKNFPELKITVQSYQHEETGALHYHTVANTIQNSFNISFKTLPQTSNGVAHILEHSVLQGSKKYPISSMFFALQGKNFETMLNAQTSLDNTEYILSSLNDKGFMNLLDVYLDATFFPLLDKMTFLREGWRYELKDDNLNYSGVVFNEMKGAYSSAMRVAFMGMINQAFNKTQYKSDSGGYPLDIPNLTYEEFKQFHETFYHPSNTIFYSYGSISAQEIQDKLESNVLSHFEKKQINNTVDIANTSKEAQMLKGTHPAPDGQILIKGYPLPNVSSIEDLFQIDLLLALFKSGKTDISQYLLNLGTNLNIQYMHLMDVAKPTLAFIFGDKEINLSETETFLKDYFKKIKTEGFEEIDIDNLFNTLELNIREGESSQSQKGLAIFNRYNRALRYGIKNVEEVHNIDTLHQLKTKMLNKEYIASLIDQYFLNNKATISYISVADPEYSKKLDKTINEKLNDATKLLTQEQKEEIKKYNEELNTRKIEGSDILPQLTLNDIKIKFPKEIEFQLNKEDIYFVEGENKVSYFKSHYSLNHLNKEELYYFNLASSLMSILPLKGMSLEQSNMWKETAISELDSGIKTVSSTNDLFDLYTYVEAKSLSENSPALFNKVQDFAHKIDFNHPEIIKNTVESMWNSYIASYQDSANQVAILESQSKLSKNISFKKEMNLDYYQNFLHPLLEKMKQGDLSYIEDLDNAYKKAFAHQPLSFFNGEEKYLSLAQKAVADRKYLPLNKTTHNIDYEINKEETLSTINMNVPVSNVAYSLSGPSKGDADLQKLQVLSRYIQDYLLSNIREKNGAYGAQASVIEGAFTMFSYRDPNPHKTVEIMRSVGEYLINNDIDIEKLNTTKLTLIKEFNKPYADIELVERKFNRVLREKEISYEEIYNNIINVSANDIKEMANKYFVGSQASIAITTNEEIINEHFSVKKNKMKIH